MTTNTTYFKAPIKSLKSSWVTVAFSKPKVAPLLIKRSLSNNRSMLQTSMGKTVTSSNRTNANLY